MYYLRVALGLIQIGLHVILAYDVFQVRELLISLSKLKDFPGNNDRSQYIGNMTRIIVGVIILLLMSQALKMINLAIGLHKSHHRQIMTSGILDIFNMVFFVNIVVLCYLTNGSFTKNPEFTPGDIRHIFGIVLSIASCALTFLLVSKYRQLDTLPLPNISLLYKLRVFLGLFQVASIFLITKIGNLSQEYKREESCLQEVIDKITQASGNKYNLNGLKLLVNICRKISLVCITFVAIECFRKTILAVGLHKNNPVVILASETLTILVLSLLGWLIFLLKETELLNASTSEITYEYKPSNIINPPSEIVTCGMLITTSIVSTTLCLILSFKLVRQSRNAIA